MREPASKKSATPAPAEHADPRPPYEHGNALLLSGDSKGALAAYREAVKMAPSDPIGFRGLGLAYEQEGEAALAVRALRRYQKLAPDAPDHDLIAKRIAKLSKRSKQK
jgi:Flp pilus assembly protein TadD